MSSSRNLVHVITAFAAQAAAAGIVIIGGHGTAGAAVTHPLPSCRAELAAYRLVSRQAGLRIGSTLTQPVSATGPGTWARELRRAGDLPLAQAAAAIRDRRSDEQFVMALTASASAVLQQASSASGAGICRH